MADIVALSSPENYNQKLVVQSSHALNTESVTWTAQPTNPTEVTKGQDVSLTWSYSLTADELTKSNTYFSIKWSKFNPSSSAYGQLATYIKIVGQVPAYDEDAPHIVIDRSTGVNSATLQINDIRIDDEGIYKIEISVEFPGTAIAADHEVNFTVLGTFNVKGVYHSLTV